MGRPYRAAKIRVPLQFAGDGVTHHGISLDWSVSLCRPCSAAIAAGKRFSVAERLLLQPFSDNEILGSFANAWHVAPGASLLDVSRPQRRLWQSRPRHGNSSELSPRRLNKEQISA
jgi:hypothetical protein